MIGAQDPAHHAINAPHGDGGVSRPVKIVARIRLEGRELEGDCNHGPACPVGRLKSVVNICTPNDNPKMLGDHSFESQVEFVET